MSALGGKYQLGERIGGGGMADVFRAQIQGAEGFSRAVAIKRMKRSISTDKDFAKLFVDEARLAAKLQHPNVVQTLDFDRDEQGCFYLVMELIEGVDLRALVQSGRVPISVAVYICAEVLRAMDYAHEMVDDGRPLTIVHRDISPHNVMLSWQAGVKVVDFGIAKAIAGSLASHSGSLKGKVSYMSPEQVHGQALDGRSDLFALGIILHELLTGQRLFIAETEAATLSKLLTQPIAHPQALNDQVPADLDAIVMKLLMRDREQRYIRAQDAMNALLECSISAMRGRSDLERLLAERFANRAPRRVSMLSRPPPTADDAQQAMALGQTQPSSSSGAFSTIAEAQTVPAVPGAQGASAPLVPKRTHTAGPSSPSDASADDEPLVVPRHSRLPLAIAALVLTGAAVFAAQYLGKDDTAPPVQVLATAIDAAPALAPAPGPDAAAPPTVDASPSDASPEVPTRRPEPEDESATRKASLTIRVKPWATVQVDGKRYGQTPQTIELRRGKHRILLENPGLDRREKFTLTLKAGEKQAIDKDWR